MTNAEPYTLREIETTHSVALSRERIIATVEHGYRRVPQPGIEDLNKWGMKLLEVTGFYPAEELVDTLRLASEFDGVVTMLLDSEGILTIAHAGALIYKEPVGDQAPLALARHLYGLDQKMQQERAA